MTRRGLLAGRPITAIASTLVALGLATAISWAIEPPAAAPTGIAVSDSGRSVLVQLQPRIGCADAVLDLTGGRAIRDTAVEVQPIAPLMGMAMPPVAGRIDASGTATVATCFSMTGPWELHVHSGTVDLVVPVTVTG